MSEAPNTSINETQWPRAMRSYGLVQERCV